ncbi:endo alpha-1,4 polygalactosaminidase [Vallitalea sediminicola]
MTRLLSLILIIPLFLYCLSGNTLFNNSYGVFIGCSPESMDEFIDYEEIVIDAFYYDNEQIATLHNKNVKVYSYLNIGSIEDFRPYYNYLKDMTLDDYENWPEEKWLDLTNEKCRNYIIDVLAKDLSDKGIDGFFLDNLDNYYLYNNDEVYNGLLNIITRLNKQYNLPLIANGGYEFFNDSLNRNADISSLVYGVNHESVFSKIDFDNNELTVNDKDDCDFLLSHIDRLHKNGVNIYVIEYTSNKKLRKKMSRYFIKKGYSYYITDNIELN